MHFELRPSGQQATRASPSLRGSPVGAPFMPDVSPIEPTKMGEMEPACTSKMPHAKSHPGRALASAAGAILALALTLWLWPAIAAAEPVHALAMHGQPKHKPGFTYFPYVNPDAPR